MQQVQIEDIVFMFNRKNTTQNNIITEHKMKCDTTTNVKHTEDRDSGKDLWEKHGHITLL